MGTATVIAETVFQRQAQYCPLIDVATTKSRETSFFMFIGLFFFRFPEQIIAYIYCQE